MFLCIFTPECAQEALTHIRSRSMLWCPAFSQRSIFRSYATASAFGIFLSSLSVAAGAASLEGTRFLYRYIHLNLYCNFSGLKYFKLI